METDRLSYLLRHEATAHGKEDYKHLAADALESLSAEVECLRAKLAEATAWRPISTAPVEGRILLWRAHGAVPIIARYDPIYGAFEDEFGEHVYHGTHWMPLPLPPEESK